MSPFFKRTCLALSMLGLIPSVGYSATDMTTKVSGFLDTQYQWQNKAGTSNGFVLNDAAIYMSASMGDVEAKIDLPFASAAGTNAFTVTAAKAQAYFDWKHDSCTFRFGQFDTIFGFEAEDTADINLSTLGLVKTNMLPRTHMGLMYNHNFNGQFALSALIADPQNEGKLTNGTTSQNLEYGIQLGVMAIPSFKFGVGYLMHKIGTETRTLLDVTANYTQGSFGLDLGLDLRKPATAGADSAMGFVIEPNWAMNESWNGTIRFENMSKNTGFAGNYSDMQIAIGPQYAVNKNLKLKVDYTFHSSKALETTPEATKTHGFNVGGVFRF